MQADFQETRRSIAAAGESHDVVEQREYRLQCARHVGPGGRIQDTIDIDHVVGGNNAVIDQESFGSGTGVEFHREIYQLENHDTGKGGNAQGIKT